MKTMISGLFLFMIMAGQVNADLPVGHGEYVDFGCGLRIERFDSSMAIKPKPPQGELLTDYIAIWDDEDIRLTYQNEEELDGAHSPLAVTMHDTIYVYFSYNVFEPFSYGIVSLIRLFGYGQIREYPEQVTDTTTGYVLFPRLLHPSNNGIHIVNGGYHLHEINDRFIHYSRTNMDGFNWQLRETWFDDHLEPTFGQGGGTAKEDTMFYATFYFGDRIGRVDSVTFVRSFDGGSNWSEDRFIPVEYNPTYMASLAFIDGRLHFIGHVNEPRIEIGYHYSDDLGDTWYYWGALSSPDTISSQWPSLAIDEQGNMCACWFDYKYGAGPGGLSGTLLCRKSTDNGYTWSDEFIASDTNTIQRNHIYLDGDYIMAVWFDHRDDGWLSPHIYYAESHDFGETWTASREIMDQTSFKNWMEFKTRAGHLYLFWTDRRDGGQEEVYFKHGMLSQTGVIEEDDNIPSKHSILSAYPNPFNSSTVIRFDLPVAGEVNLTIFDIMGRRVATLINGRAEAGRHKVTWDAARFASGIYFVGLKAEAVTEAVKILLIK